MNTQKRQLSKMMEIYVLFWYRFKTVHMHNKSTSVVVHVYIIKMSIIPGIPMPNSNTVVFKISFIRLISFGGGGSEWSNS